METLADHATVQVYRRGVRLVLLHDRLHECLAAYVRYLCVFLLQLADLLPLDRVTRLHAWRLPREYVLNREDLVEELELLLRHFLVLLGDGDAVELKKGQRVRVIGYGVDGTYLVDVLKSVDDEALEGARVQHLVVVDVELVQ